MRKDVDPKLTRGRIRTGPYASDDSFGIVGAFQVDSPKGYRLLIIASNGEGWEHVSVSIPGKKRTPSWEEMAFVKDLFWEKDEPAIQYHPDEANYVNTHEYVLHIWRPLNWELQVPPWYLVGMKPKEKRH